MARFPGRTRGMTARMETTGTITPIGIPTRHKTSLTRASCRTPGTRRIVFRGVQILRITNLSCTRARGSGYRIVTHSYPRNIDDSASDPLLFFIYALSAPTANVIINSTGTRVLRVPVDQLAGAIAGNRCISSFH